MRPTILRCSIHVAFAVLGLACAAGLFLSAADRVAPTEPTCLILNTGCWSGAAYAYNDASAPECIVADNACNVANLMNFVWCNEYEGTHRPQFAQRGHFGGFDAALVSIYEAATETSAKTLVYFNAPGNLTNFVDPPMTLRTRLVLQRIRQEIPETAADVDTYLRVLHGSVGYRKAVAELGADWKPAPAEASGPTCSDKDCSPGWRQRLAGLKESFTERSFALYDWSFDRLSHGLRRPRLSTSFAPSERIVQLLDECAARYLDPENDPWVWRLGTSDKFWVCCGGDEVWQAWIRIVDKVCEARQVRLVYYVPPHVHVTEAEYRESFKPEYVDRVRRDCAPYPRITVVDHAAAPGFTAADLCSWDHAHNVRIKAGYLHNVIGRLKEARLLTAALVDMGALDHDGEARYLGSAWAGEAHLPSGPSSINFAPLDKTTLIQEHILEPEVRILSTQVKEN